MGIPAAFRWLSAKYPKIISSVKEAKPEEVDGHTIPFKRDDPNPNGQEFDNLYLDMNGIVHPCSHPEDRPAPATEGDMMLEVFKYTQRVVNMVRPRKLLMIAIDGVAPRAKMNQQRSRRFRSAQEAKEKDEEMAAFAKMLKSQNKGEVNENVQEQLQKKTWDSNAITPGTPFMGILAASLRYWIAYKLNTDPMWENLKIIISDASVPGEGEHKIMQFIRSQRSSPEHNPNTRHVLYGLDADLIMLGLATHEPDFHILREDVFFQETKAKTCHTCGQVGHMAAACTGQAKIKQGAYDEKGTVPVEKPFIWLHVSVLREYLAAEMFVPNQGFKFDLERALDDWIFMCFFVGNDFLPHLPSLDIRDQGIDTLMSIWRENLAAMGGYVTKDGHVDLARAQVILSGLAGQEDAIFKRRRAAEQRKEAGNKRRKIEEARREERKQIPRQNSQFSAPDAANIETVDLASLRDPKLGFGRRNAPPGANGITHDEVMKGSDAQANQANKSAAAVLKDRLKAKNSNESIPGLQNSEANGQLNGSIEGPPGLATPAKRKADELDSSATETPTGEYTPQSAAKQNNPDDPPEDTVKLWEEGYGERYYEQKFHVSPDDHAFRHKVARDYVEGLAWVLLYYFQGCPSWTWYYPYHYAPFAADFVELDQMKLDFDKGKPFKPYEQLMGVMPAASNHTIPEVFRSLMTDGDSDIVDFYPEQFDVDLNGKKWAWQGVALLPFIDERRLLKAMNERYPQLTADEIKRNETGRDVLIFNDSHALYLEVAANFYSKKQGSPKFSITPRTSDGLAGKVEKDEDFLPQSSLSFPIGNGAMPDIDQNSSINVFFDHPVSTNIHKSMLLRGVQMPDPVLSPADIAAVKERTSRNGRSYGGAPLDHGNGYRGNGRGGRGGRGGGGGGHMPNSGSQRPNPFAAHLPPGMVPNGGPTPGMPPMPQGWMPPPNVAAFGASFGRGQPPMPPMPFNPGNNQYPDPRIPPPRDPRYDNNSSGGYGGNNYNQGYGRY
ncbi:MAG: 5'-3' exoribonuclease 2 [Chrysothrix sp. TS-e1954]|nr:MAG: 5'-3' exoribonuclease 2 [Chrysothrix sp. TS-e1954]